MKLLFHLLPEYTWKLAFDDFTAACSVTAIVIPQSIAYALLAGLPAQFGLYTSIIPVFVYGLLGTSRHLCIGTFAIISLLVNRVAEDLALDLFGISNERTLVSIALSLTFLVGVVKLMLSFLRIGNFIAKYLLPDAFVTALTCASAFYIATPQIASTFRLQNLVKYRGPFSLIYTWLDMVPSIFKQGHMPTFCLSIFTLLTILGIQRLNYWFETRRGNADVHSNRDQTMEIVENNLSKDNESSISSEGSETSTQSRPSSRQELMRPNVMGRKSIVIPEILVAIILSSLVCVGLNFSKFNAEIPIIGPIPSGLPRSVIPFLYNDYCTPDLPRCPEVGQYALNLLWPAVNIAFVSATLSIAVSQYFAKQLEYFESISINQELFALAAANIIGSILGQAFVASGSLSRTAIAIKSGAKTQLAGIISGALALFVLASPLTYVLQFIPLPCLAIIVLFAVIGLMTKVKKGYDLVLSACKLDIFNLYLHELANAILWWVVFLTAMLFDIDIGILVGVSFSILNYIWISSFPHVYEFGIFTMIEEESGDAENVQIFDKEYQNKAFMFGSFQLPTIDTPVSLAPEYFVTLAGVRFYRFEAPRLLQRPRILKSVISSMTIDQNSELIIQVPSALLDCHLPFDNIRLVPYETSFEDFYNEKARQNR